MAHFTCGCPLGELHFSDQLGSYPGRHGLVLDAGREGRCRDLVMQFLKGRVTEAGADVPDVAPAFPVLTASTSAPK